MPFEVYKPRHRYMYAACICIAAVFIIGLLAASARTMVQSPLYPLDRDAKLVYPTCPQQMPDHLDSINYLNGPPTERFRGSLCFSMDLNALIEDLYL